MSGLRGDQLLKARHRNEEKRMMYEKITQDNHRKYYTADWENKTNVVVQRNAIERRFVQIRLAQQQRLEERRQKLADLLNAEQEAYKVELAGLGETKQQRKERMQNRALELKQAREAERQAYVEEMNYKRWRLAADDLREADSKNFLLKCHIERQKQVNEKVVKLQIKEREDKIFDALWEEERMKRVEKEKEEMIREREANRVVRLALDQQLVEMKDRRDEAKRLEEEEAAIQFELWELDQKEAAIKAQEVVEQKFKRNKALMEFNEFKLKERAVILAKQREEDLAFVKSVLEREQAEDSARAAEQERYRNEMKKYRKHLVEMMKKEADDDEYLDQLRNQELEKAWNKRMEGWAREQQARDRLLKQVMEERQVQIEERYQQLERERQQVIDDRVRLVEEVERLRELDAENNVKRLEERREFDDTIQAQINEKRQRAEWAKIRQRNEDRAAAFAERQHQQRLNAEKERMKLEALAITGNRF